VVAPEGNPCNPTGDADTASFWTQWIASKLTGGLNLPGMQESMKSAVQVVIKNASLAGRIGTALPIVSAAISALTFMLQMSALTVTFDISPVLVRTKDSHPHGREATITSYLKYDLEGSSLDGGAGIKNCLLVFLNSLGIQAALPSDGGIEGAKLTFRGAAGFGHGLNTADAFVQFPNQAEISQDTGAGGLRTIVVQGIQQREAKGEHASEWSREASVSILAQPEAENLRSLASQFFDSFVALGAGPIGLVGPMIGVLKTVEYDLGEYSFLVTDWQLGWIYKVPTLGIVGKKCDGLGGEWDLTFQAYNNGTALDTSWVATIDAATLEGTYIYPASTTISGVTQTWHSTGGRASVTLEAQGRVKLDMTGGVTTFTVEAPGGTSTATLPDPVWTYIWEPAGDECTPTPGR
jgi:hypothetical protein